MEFLKKYELWDDDDKDYRINCFEQIGWTDPFPKENLFKSKFSKPDDIDNLVYAKSRFNPDEPPQVVYIPRREMMFKMMRACIEVKNTEELWVQNSEI